MRQLNIEIVPSDAARRRVWDYTWIATLIIFVLAFTRDYSASLRHAGLSINGGALWGRDFVNVYTAGALVLNDNLTILYDLTKYHRFQSALFAPSQLLDHNYSYPPVTLFYTWILALAPYPAALVSWLVMTGVAFGAAARPYLAAAGLRSWVAILLPASLVNIWAGHYGFVVGSLWLAAWHLLERRPRLAGVLIGFMIVKPHLAILAPIVLAYRREWTTFIAAAVTVVVLVLSSAAIFGIGLWETYFTVTVGYQVGLIDQLGTFFIRMMPTVSPALSMLGFSRDSALLCQIVAGGAAVIFLLRFMPDDNRRAGLATGVATFLVLPYAFAYDMTVFSVASVGILAAFRDRGSFGMTLLAALAFTTPMIVTIANSFGLTIAPLLIALTLYWLIRPPEALKSLSAPATAALAR